MNTCQTSPVPSTCPMQPVWWDAGTVLGKRGASGFDFSTDPLPARRAVAFSNRITESELFEKHFPSIVESCISAAGENAENPLRCQVHHVDGT